MTRREPMAARPPLTEAQQSLAQAQLPLVERIARGLLRRHPHADGDELESAGHLALVEAARTYDPAKNDSFAAYAWAHVYGAMAAPLAAGNPVVHEALAAMRRLGLELSTTLRHESDPFTEPPKDVAQSLGEVCDEIVAAALFGLSGAPSMRSGDDVLIQHEEHRRATAALRNELSRLAESERRLLELRYGEGRAIRDVAATLGLSKTTADRRCKAALARVREALARRGITAPPPLEGRATYPDEPRPAT